MSKHAGKQLLFRVAGVVFGVTILLQSAAVAGGTYYTAYNIWYEPGKEKALWCINYKTGSVIPAGTEVRNIKVTPAAAGRKAGAQPLSLSFETTDGEQYWVNFVRRFHPGKTLEDYKAAMFTDKNFAELTRGLNAKEIAAIRNAELVVGMSKRAVLISYGLPPEHKTPSLEDATWRYWMNRFRSKEIYFDETGRTFKPKPRPNTL